MKPPATSHTINVATLHRELGIPADYAQTRGLSFQPEADASHLLTIAKYGDRKIQLIPPTASAWTRMSATARADGITLLPLSGFRSVARQTEIVRAKLAVGHSIDAVLSINAAPGFSEHHTGRALDIGTVGCPHFEECFAETPAFAWLIQHACSFGFALSYPRDNTHGIAFEPWHWLWR